MTNKDKGVSVRQRLRDFSQNNDIAYDNLETAFLIERLVVRLIADKELGKKLVFKGGFVGLRVYNSGRFTTDLDALITNSKIDIALNIAKEKAETSLDDGVWFRFEDQIDLATQGEYGGVRQIYRSGIGEVPANLQKQRIIHFDIGIGDPVTPAPKITSLPTYLAKNEDISWAVYPIETIIAEKLHALISHGDLNSRSKDVYDLSLFLARADTSLLKRAVKDTFEFRKTPIPEKLANAVKGIDSKNLERGWASAMASIVEPPVFSAAFEEVVKHLFRIESDNGK